MKNDSFSENDTQTLIDWMYMTGSMYGPKLSYFFRGPETVP